MTLKYSKQSWKEPASRTPHTKYMLLPLARSPQPAMLLAWVCHIWCVGVLLPPAQASTPGSHMYQAYGSDAFHKSALLESLQCHNDYFSYIRCSWTEKTEARTPVFLFHLDTEEYRESPCLPYRPPIHLPGGWTTFQCQYNTTMFTIGENDGFLFRTPHVHLLSWVFNLSLHERSCLLLNVSPTLSERGGALLHWRTCLRQSPAANYQLSYRPLEGNWEVVEVSAMAWKIEADSLANGSWYEAKVRAPVGRGSWGDWSPVVQWKTKGTMLPGPTNLQCLSDGELKVLCSWELSKELARFVIYRLWYRFRGIAKNELCGDPKVSEKPGEPALLFSCSLLLVSQHSELLLNLTPTYIFRSFPVAEHIWLPHPDLVQVKEKDGHWKLSWTPSKTELVPVIYEICYWCIETPKERHCYNSPLTYSDISQASLLSGSRYTAQVRAMIGPSEYRGNSSDWSEPVEWTTPPAVSMLVYLLPGACVIIFALILLYGFPSCSRIIQSWLKSIPTPLKSKVLNMGFPASWLAVHIEQDQATISSVEMLENTQIPPACLDLSGHHSQPMWLMSADDMGLYQCIAEQGWESASDRGGQRHNGPSKDTPLACLALPFIIGPSGFPLPDGLAINHLCGRDDPYVSPACQSALTRCVLQYVEVPSPSTGPYLKATVDESLESCKLQPLLNLDSDSYTPASTPLLTKAPSQV
ncbi:cytokine receptor common subunit beta-like [Brienomyrus brachyistius]|uniref:cytokine receptor common subunit beta-like n=1 Tax=Brienomyrus brachyistius TaxID=42636 RepID=UPI0020B418D0|nr:cytokine receptor common subunit beta-like [Brienomyrus brachyistius]XP_048870145.1 cytokine receptor common subunit beta-like [Brienomyrus brachyistius]XP_048870146.1 cytokine receptor common subunit beta-like [Brienomyrus brachyistius]